MEGLRHLLGGLLLKPRFPSPFRQAAIRPSEEQLRMLAPRAHGDPRVSPLPITSPSLSPFPTPPLSARAPLPRAGYLYPGAAADRQLGAGRRLTGMSEAEMTGWWAVLPLLAGLLGRASPLLPGVRLRHG